MTNNNSVKERLNVFIKYKHLSKRKFCELISVCSSYVTNISKSIQPDKIERISEQFPELNTGWLMTGNGEMLNEPLVHKLVEPPKACLPCAAKVEEIKRLTNKIIELQDRLLDVDTKK